ncbi:MAG TPA: glycosyltransferase, partial [Planctomycetia bacterium]|nr:glycosyltransferase [Planctomycetia bacterium]
LAEWASRRPGDVRVLSYPRNRGKGHAIRVGMLAARGEWRIFTDVDLAYRFSDIEVLARRLREGAQLAIASRVHPESRIQAPQYLLGYLFRRSMQSRIFSALVQAMLPIRQGDTQAGLKGMSARAAKALLPFITSDRFEFDCELLTAAAKLGWEVVESPVVVAYDGASTTVTGLSALQMLRGVRRIAKAWRKGVPLVAPPRAVLEPYVELTPAVPFAVEMAA